MLIAGIGLGSNLGDRERTLQRAIDALARTPGLRVVAASPLYETEPVGPPQPRYLNAAARLESTLAPADLMATLLAIEAAHGRRRTRRWGPRTLDLDVLVLCDPNGFEIVEVDLPELRAPHPALESRAFALAPLLDVLPELGPRFGARLAALGGPPPRAERGQSIVVSEHHR